MAAPQLHPPTQNSIFVIAPYWADGAWVFDDPSRGLLREPFVAGVPEVLNDLVAGIPRARLGFRLIFSARRFPGAQAGFVRGRTETGGTWYIADDGRKGWLCPALFKYFTVAPAELYVRAEPIH
jgi:hypothetical protein